MASTTTQRHTVLQNGRSEARTGFVEWLRNWAEHIEREQMFTRSHCETSVKLHRRARGVTISDQCGQYGTRPETQGRWLDYDPDLDGEIHPINIVGPALNTNQNACLQSNSSTEVRSANQSAKHQQNAMRWQRVSDYMERTTWDEGLRGFIFDAVQKDGTILVRSFKEKCDEQTVAEIREKKMGLAMYECPECGDMGIHEMDEDALGEQELAPAPPELSGEGDGAADQFAGGGMQSGMGTVNCPKCGKPTPAMITEVSKYDLDESEVPVYDIKSEIIPFFNFTIDAAGAKIKGIQGAKWLQIQRLVDRVDLATKYPEMGFRGAAANWSYQVRCDYALACGAWHYLNYADTNMRQEFQKFEERTIYLHADAYADYVSPEDWEFVNAKGDLILSIHAGETIEEAFEKQYGYKTNGLAFVWIDETLVDILSPDEHCTNFRECFSDIHWRRDSGSYLSSPYYSIVSLQDDLTLLNSMRHNIIARNAFIPVYFDSLIFEKSDFTNEFIGSKNAHLLEDRDLSKSVVQLPVPTPSPELSNQMEFLWSIKDDVSLVTPAMRGESQKGETFGAQRQQLEQSYGSLTSVLKSFALCKIASFKQKARMAQECWTEEQFKSVGSEFGETWNEQEIAEMCSTNFDKDMIVTYKTGSEMPQSNMDRELRFAQGLNALGQFMEMGIVPPDKLQKLLEKIDEMAGFDFDLTGLEVNEILAQKRYLDLARICSQMGTMSFEEVQMTKQNVTQIDPMTSQPITQMDVLTERIFAEAKISFSQHEDLAQEKNFFIERIRLEQGKTKPDYLLLEVLHMVIDNIDQAGQMLAQEALESDPAYQAQIAAQGQAEAQAEADRQSQQQQSDAAMAESQQARADDQQARADSGAETERAQILDLAKAKSDQEHEIEKMKLAAKLAPKPPETKKK